MPDDAHQRSATDSSPTTSPSSNTDAQPTAGDDDNDQITAGTYLDIFTYSKPGEDLNWTKVKDPVKRESIQNTIQARKDREKKTSDEIRDMNNEVMAENEPTPLDGSGVKRLPTPPGVPPPGPEREEWLRKLHEAEEDLRQRRTSGPLSRLIAKRNKERHELLYGFHGPGCGCGKP